MSAARERKVTLTDVADLAGVDRSVVSKVLNNDPALKIRESTRRRVMSAIDALDYHPHAMARGLSTARTGMYGLMIPDFTNPIYSTIIIGAERAAAERKYMLLTGSPAGRSTSGQYLDLLGRGRVDGLLVAGGMVGGEVTDRLRGLGVPWVLLNRQAPGHLRHLMLDDAKASALAVEHLVGLGHERIAHLAGPKSADTARRRTAGFRRAMKEAGLPIGRGLIVEATYTHAGGYQGMQQLLDVASPPTAVVVANVASAIGALSATNRRKIAVPDELSVIAVHDLALAAFLNPPLTTVSMPLQELGYRGIEVLSTLSGDEPVEEVLTGPMTLVERESTAPPRH